MLLKEFDWDAEWKRVQTARSAAFDPSFWDERAPSFRKRNIQDYNETFLAVANLQKDWSVLDVGCGSGVFSIPLAQEGHEVLALDFSAGMLEQLASEAQEQGIAEGSIKSIQGSWDDDWQELGIAQKSVDAAIASRSLLTLELVASLKKLNETARERVCMSVGVQSFPFYDIKLMEALGRETSPLGDYFLVLGALASMGIFAEVRFVGTAKRDVYLSREGARASIEQSLGKMTEEEHARLECYLNEHLIPWQLTAKERNHLIKWTPQQDIRVAEDAESNNPEAEYSGLAKDYMRDTRWALISWDVKKGAA